MAFRGETLFSSIPSATLSLGLGPLTRLFSVLLLELQRYRGTYRCAEQVTGHPLWADYYLLRNKRTRYDRKKLMNFLGGSGGYATKKLPKLSEGSFIAEGTHF